MVTRALLRSAALVALFALIAAFLAATAAAAEPSELVRPLSLRDALERADAHAPAVVRVMRGLGVARARRVGAGVVLPTNPRLSFEARPGFPVGAGAFGYASTLDFLFEVGGAPAAREVEAERRTRVAARELAVERLQARADALVAYLRTSLAELRIAESNAVLAIGDRIHAASRLRAEAGASGDIEESLAETAVGELRAAVADALRQHEVHLSELRELLDLPATDALVLTTPLEEPNEVPPGDILVRRALASRPELDLIRERVLALEATDRRLARETFPKVGAYLGVDASPLSPMFVVAGVSIELPFAQRNQGPRAIAQAERAGELSQLELQGRRIARDVMAARAGYEARRTQFKGITEQALPAAERTLELVELGWRSGRFDLFRVTSAARDVGRVRGLRVDALEAAWVERVALERAVGGAL